MHITCRKNAHAHARINAHADGKTNAHASIYEERLQMHSSMHTYRLCHAVKHIWVADLTVILGWGTIVDHNLWRGVQGPSLCSQAP